MNENKKSVFFSFEIYFCLFVFFLSLFFVHRTTLFIFFVSLFNTALFIWIKKVIRWQMREIHSEQNRIIGFFHFGTVYLYQYKNRFFPSIAMHMSHVLRLSNHVLCLNDTSHIKFVWIKWSIIALFYYFYSLFNIFTLCLFVVTINIVTRCRMNIGENILIRIDVVKK